MRTTIDIPEREHNIFLGLAHAQRTSLSKIVIELAIRGLKAPALAEELTGMEKIDPKTGFRVFRSGRSMTAEDLKAMDDEW